MASLTVRNLEEALKARLRIRAASRGRSMEDEVRHILRAALNESRLTSPDLGARIRRRFASLGDVQLPIAAREAVREPEPLGHAALARRRNVRDAARPPRSRG